MIEERQKASWAFELKHYHGIDIFANSKHLKGE